ncbi:TauD/TfdA family dioxygenase [uncultured Chryseobacterium sp.]|uniref:TauD/TfdA family dioxygenase n=1 Tax=uncultured Chryseobacterium sp. TaxID=259322 RepID=UPI0025E7B782|nr:TauD/TfdA family dioxygenase [uncultured Chryseobacterium sp.]
MEGPGLLINYQWGEHPGEATIKEDLQQGYPLVIKNFPLSDEELQLFISRLGTALDERRNNNGKSVFDVTIVRHNNFFTSIANSNLAFPLHTDCADFDTIPNMIGLLCMEPDEEGQGTNTFMLLSSLLNYLTEDEKQKMLGKKWKFGNQLRSILSFEDGNYALCYDRITMESFSRLEATEIDELNKLDQLFKSLSFEIKLEKGDLILFRNDLMLHGRDKIHTDSKRWIKRIRFDTK